MGTETRTRVALGALLVATLLSFELLFDADGHVGPSVLACALAMGITALTRRWGAGPFLTFELSLAALFWYLTLVFQASESFYGIPTPGAGTGISRLISDAAEAASVDYAPIPVRAGYVIMIVVGFWLATTIAEVATFRWRRPILASLPCIVLFAIPVVVGSNRGSGFFLVLFLSMLLLFWASESSHRLRSWGRWVTTWSDRKKDEEPRSVTGGLAFRMGATCVVATIAAPMFLPTVGGEWFPWRSGSGSGNGSGSGSESGEVNLLVDIAPKLLEQSGQTLFKVEAEDAAYWRLASLVDFDGRRWHEIESSRVLLSGELGQPPPGASPDGEDLLEQTVDIVALGGEFLPAAVQPTSINGIQTAYSTETQDLHVNEVGSDTAYSVTSAVLTPTYNQLREADAGSPPTELAAATYTETQGTTSSRRVQRLLDSWMKGVRGDFEQLLTLQERLRGPEFGYSTNVEYAESDNYLEKFLFEDKVGFCQQFATAFALLARELGHPTRVSVGFLPGSQTAALSGLSEFTVRGTDAHAWPEVYFEEFGWIRFEPTARGLSAIPVYTIPPLGFGIREGGGTANTPGGPAPDDPAGTLGPAPDNPDVAAAPEEPIPPPVEEPAWQPAFGRLVSLLALVLVVWAIVVPLLKRARNKRRYRRAREPAEIALAAWAHFEDDAGEMFLPRSPAESASTFVKRLAAERRVTAFASERLALLYETAAYSAARMSRDEAAEAKRLAGALAADLWTRASLWQKATRLFSIRSLLPRAGVRLPRRLGTRAAT